MFTNKQINLFVSTWNITTLTTFIFSLFPLPPHLLPPRPLSSPPPLPAAVSAAAVSVAAVSRFRPPPLPPPHLSPPRPLLAPPPPLSPPLPRHDSHFRCYCCCFLVDCCLPPLLPLFPSAAAVLACPRRCHRCCLPAPLPMSPPPATAA